MSMSHKALVLLAGMALGQYAMAQDGHDKAMRELASHSGCLTCHGIDAPKPGPDGMAPVGPAWIDVARQYKGKPGADEFLTRVVLEGSSPYSSHWKGKVSGLAMPPNAVAIKKDDALELVRWILKLDH